MAARKRVAVVGMADGPEADEGPGVLACLARARFERVAVLCHENESGALRPGCCERAILVPHHESSTQVSNLVEAVRAEGLDVLLPGSARVAVMLARSADTLRSAGAGLCTPQLEAAALDTLHGVRLAGRHPLPGTPVLGACGGTYPVVLQSSCGARRRAGDEWEALRAHEALLRSGPAGTETPSVEAINWIPHATFEVALVADGRGVAVASSAVRVLADDDRLRPWLAVTVENDGLVDAAARVALQLELQGPSRFLFLLDAHGFALVDARAGFPLWIEVTTVGGPPLVELAVRAALGEELATVDSIPCTPAGVLFSQTAEDALAPSPR